jgi:DNA-binding NarL/FixJ family response regulator
VPFDGCAHGTALLPSPHADRCVTGLDPVSDPALEPALEPARAAAADHDWARCLDLANLAVVGDERGEAERAVLVADSSWWLGRLEECIEARQRAFELYEALGDEVQAGVTAVWLYEHHCLRARPAVGAAWLARGRRLLAGAPDGPERGVLLLRELEVAHGDGRYEDAAELGAEARALARRIGSADLEAEALQALGRVHIDAGDAVVGLRLLDEAMLSAVEGRLGAYSTGKVYCSLISACEEVGDLARAAEWTEMTARWASAHPFAIFPGICRVHRATLLGLRGDLLDAEAEATRACAELLDGHLPNVASAFAEVGDIRRRLGDLDGAEVALARAEELRGRPCAGTALLRLAQGRADEATRIIGTCLADRSASRLARARVLPAAAQIAIGAGDLLFAEECVEELEQIADAFDLAFLRAAAASARGRLLLAEGEPRAACALLHDALRRWQELAVPYEAATARTLLGQAQRDSGDEDGAHASFATARAEFDAMGAAPTAAALDPARVLPPRPGGLTAREVEVLGLVALGWSNKDIARELGLSVKTVSRHLSNIFTKIDVASRSAATAFAFEHRIVTGPGSR